MASGVLGKSGLGSLTPTSTVLSLLCFFFFFLPFLNLHRSARFSFSLYSLLKHTKNQQVTSGRARVFEKKKNPSFLCSRQLPMESSSITSAVTRKSELKATWGEKTPLRCRRCCRCASFFSPFLFLFHFLFIQPHHSYAPPPT